MAIEYPEKTYSELADIELCHMDRELLIFYVLCGEITYSNGQPKFYTAAEIAEKLEREIRRQESFAQR